MGPYKNRSCSVRERMSSAEKSFKSDFVHTKVMPHTKIEKAAKKKPVKDFDFCGRRILNMTEV